MKNIIMLFVFAILLVPSPVLSADGVININGALTGYTCKIDGNPGYATKTVVLPALSVSTLANPSDTAGLTAFSFQLTECDGASAQFYFEPENINVDLATGYLLNKAVITPADHVQVQLLNDQQVVMDLKAPINSQNSQKIIVNQGSATMNYFARYVAVGGSATAGNVTSAVQFSIVYE